MVDERLFFCDLSIKQEPTVRLASPFVMGFTSVSIYEMSCCPSASN